MVQKSSAISEEPRSRRGRPRSFDEDRVVEAAISAFMAKGFAATTLADLEAATGLDRSSLYGSFGGKSGLYDRATTRYLDLAEAWLFEPLLTGSSDGVADIEAFLDRFATRLSEPDAVDGCLIVNDIAAGAAPAAAARYWEVLTAGLRSALERAGAADVDARVRLVASAVLGINLLGKNNHDRDEVAAAVAALRAQVAAWRG